MKQNKHLPHSFSIQHFAFCIAAITSLMSAANAADISDVIVRQQWPWSTDVKVEYKLTNVTVPVDVSVTAFNGAVQLDSAKLASAITGDRYGISESGAYSFMIDPVKAFGTDRVALGDFRVRLSVSDSAANLDEALYRIYDLASGSCTDVTRGDLLNGHWGSIETDFSRIGDGFNTTLDDVIIWTGVTNNIDYKTTKLVMRKIPAKNKVWTIGSSGLTNARGSETQHQVKLTQDYYIGVFELTQAQYHMLNNWPNAQNNSFPDSNIRPMENARCDNAIGIQTAGNNSALPGTLPGGGTELVCWPTNSYRHLAVDNRYIKLIRNKTGVVFDIPTEAQWEFACRAGTSTPLNSGKDYTTATGKCDNVDELAWNTYSDYSSVGGTKATMPVGLKKPNAYGLYDMHGNVREMCLDAYVANIDVDGSGDPVVDPIGLLTPTATSDRVKRGGAFNDGNSGVRSSFRETWYAYNQAVMHIGYRLVCPDEGEWAK